MDAMSLQQKTEEQRSDGRKIASSHDGSKKVYDLLAKDHPTESEFKVLLQHVSPGVLAKRYLLTGLPFVFQGEPHKYLAFREAVGRIFRVPPQDIAVMGSARFGFSTSPRKQHDEGAKLLDEDSDMDLVIVSNRIFNRSLESFAYFAFSVLRDEEILKSDPRSPGEKVSIEKAKMLTLRRRAKALNFGYVSPSDLVDGSEEKQDLYDMQREAGTQLFGTAPPGPINHVNARIYRDWDSAERTYEFSFKQLADALGIRSVKMDELPDPGEA
jgi:hypothetical protein